MLDDTNALGFDDPWSRPGDFVMLKALTDLVCVSTGCPCDVDPANGWNPTDIQVRVYGETRTSSDPSGIARAQRPTWKRPERPGSTTASPGTPAISSNITAIGCPTR